jgi:hypothetical protein
MQEPAGHLSANLQQPRWFFLRVAVHSPGSHNAWNRPVSIANRGGTVIALPWAPEGDEGDGVAGRDSAADGLHAASIQAVDDGFPAIAGVVVEQTLEVRRPSVVAEAFAGVVLEADDLVLISLIGAGLLGLGRWRDEPRDQSDHNKETESQSEPEKSSAPQGRCEEPPPRRLTASPPLRKGGIFRRDHPVSFPPPYKGGARGGSAGEDFDRVQANCYAL